jgi:hypothetical protein
MADGAVAVAEAGTLRLRVVDGRALPADVRRSLLPGELLRDEEGHAVRLPRFFYEVPSWTAALETRLTQHFQLWEFMSVDVREAPELIEFPRYVPCAVVLLAGALQVVRTAAGRPVHVAANGGYRSPAHRLTRHASTHCWGCAANVYRIGDDWLWSRSVIENYGGLAREAFPGFRVRRYGPGIGEADDHLHLDVGRAVLVPHGAKAAPPEGGSDAGETEPS